MAAYRRKPYSRQSSTASFMFLPLVLAFHSWHAYRRRARVVFLADQGRPANRPHTDNTAACWFVINRTADSQPCQRPTWTISFVSAACAGRLAPTALIPTRNNAVEQLREQICKWKSPRESAVALLPDSTYSPDGLPILLSISVFYFLVFLLFTF